MTLKTNSLINANAEVYYESYTNDYAYKGTLDSGGSMDVSVDYYNPVWVLVMPYNNSAYVSITATANYINSSNSSDNSYLIAIIVPTVVGGSIFIIWITLIICWSVIRSRRNLQLHQNIAAAAIVYPANSTPQHQKFYPHQNNYNAGYVNQGAIIMGTQQPANPAHPTMNQNVYIIEPIPNTPEHIVYEPADPVPDNSIYYSQGVPDDQKY